MKYLKIFLFNDAVKIRENFTFIQLLRETKLQNKNSFKEIKQTLLIVTALYNAELLNSKHPTPFNKK